MLKIYNGQGIKVRLTQQQKNETKLKRKTLNLNINDMYQVALLFHQISLMKIKIYKCIYFNYKYCSLSTENTQKYLRALFSSCGSGSSYVSRVYVSICIILYVSFCFFSGEKLNKKYLH